VTTLDQKIRAWLDEHDACVDSDCNAETIEALRAVLDVPRYDLTRPTGHLVDDAQRRAWNRALDRARQGIAFELGISSETADAV
jgi:hypothetical protein